MSSIQYRQFGKVCASVAARCLHKNYVDEVNLGLGWDFDGELVGHVEKRPMEWCKAMVSSANPRAIDDILLLNIILNGLVSI